MPRIFGSSGLIALTVSGAVSFAAVVGIARIAPDDGASLIPPPRPWKRAPPPEVRPLDDSPSFTPTPIYEPKGWRFYNLAA